MSIYRPWQPVSRPCLPTRCGWRCAQPLAHQSNRLYDVWVKDEQHWIAKEFLKSGELEDAPRREFDALTLLQDTDIAPQPVHFAPATESLGPVVIYEFMDGEMWDRYSPTAARNSSQLCRCLADHERGCTATICGSHAAWTVR